MCGIRGHKQEDPISAKDKANVMYAKDKEWWVLIHSTTISGSVGRTRVFRSTKRSVKSRRTVFSGILNMAG